jgi:hypothetical protein
MLGMQMCVLALLKQFAQCDCMASHGRGTGIELLGDQLGFHPDFIQTAVALPRTLACVWACLTIGCLTAYFVYVSAKFTSHII